MKFFQRERQKEFGLYHWRNVLESGVDDNLALIAPREAAKDEDESVGKFQDGAILASDLSSYLAREFLGFADLCAHFKRPQLEAQYRASAKALTEAIESKLWNEKLSLYCNYNPIDKNSVERRSWTGLAPVLMDLASEEHRERVIHNNILNADHFLRAQGLASHAISEPLANQQRRGLCGRAIVSNWQGPVWVLPNALVVRILNKYGYKEEARDIYARVVKTLLHSLRNWNILALELIETLE